MANEKTPVVWDDTTKKHRPLGTGEKMGGLDASSIISSDSGNLIGTGSDGLAYVSGSGIADPAADNLIETSDQGRLTVTADRIAEWLDGHPQDASGLAASLAPGLSVELADNKTIVASGGKLHVDPTNATAAQKKKINEALADANAGLAVDEATGMLQVDFSNMPTDKFEDMMKSLKMQIPLEENKDYYVSVTNPNATDDLDENPGTQAKPFRTIQACVDWLTHTYALGEFIVTIHVMAGQYFEDIALPSFTRTSGKIVICAGNYANPPVLNNKYTSSTIMSVTGGTWDLTRLVFKGIRSAVNAGITSGLRTLAISNADSSVSLYGCELSETYTGAAPTSGYTQIRLVQIFTGATLAFRTMADYGNKLEYHKGNATQLFVLDAETGSSITMPSTNTASHVVDVAAFGESTAFAYFTSQSVFATITGGLYGQKFVVPSGESATGTTFIVRRGAGIAAPTGGFPGDVQGEPESATCGWYSVG